MIRILSPSRGVARAWAPPLLPLAAWLVLLVAALAAAACGGGGASGGAGADSTAAAEAAGADSASGDEDEKPAREERAVTVDAARVVRGDLVVSVVAEGRIRARQSTEIRAEVSGRIDRFLVDEGQTVRKGQKIAQLDDRELRVALEEARSRYLEAIGRLALDADRPDSAAATAGLDRAIAELRDLLAKGTITADEFQARRIRRELDAVRDGAYREELMHVRSGLVAARAAQERAELDLERSAIHAPFAGVITGIEVAQGERVSVGQVLCELVDNTNLEAEVAVLESDLAGIGPGREARLEVPALGETLDVAVDVLNPSIDPQSRTCSALLRVTNRAGTLRPGMFVRAAIAGEVHPDLLLVPREAILTREGRPLLFKVEDGRAQWVYVELGKSNDREVEIAAVLQGGPLDPDMLVVTSNHLTLTHNAKVKVKRVAAAGSAESEGDEAN